MRSSMADQIRSGQSIGKSTDTNFQQTWRINSAPRRNTAVYYVQNGVLKTSCINIQLIQSTPAMIPTNWFNFQQVTPLYPIQFTQISPYQPVIYTQPLLWPTTPPVQPVLIGLEHNLFHGMVGPSMEPDSQAQKPNRSYFPHLGEKLISPPSSGQELGSITHSFQAKDESSQSVAPRKHRGRVAKSELKKQSQLGNHGYRQNPSRNIVTNIGNQLITYLCTPTKSETRIRFLRPSYSKCDIEGFYIFTKKLKKETDYYLNMHKMRQFWFPENSNQNFEDYRKLVRILSAYFIAELLPSCILTSTKMKKQTKLHHMRIRKQLINLLFCKTKETSKFLHKKAISHPQQP